EKDGHDYPYEWVRWTENRNMQEFLRLAATGRVALEPLIDRVLPVERAAEAYAALAGGPPAAPLAVLLDYTSAADRSPAADRRHTIDVVPSRSRGRGVAVAVVGPGSFATAVHLPNLASLAPRARLRAVVGRAGVPAREAARTFAGAYATVDLDRVLGDDAVDLVVIATRHDRHAALAERALRAGKAVFLEKPAALDREQLYALDAAVRQTGNPIVVGFNRRFAPDVVALAGVLRRRRGPLVASYRIHAGALPAEHWLRGPEGGGRLIGEACHMLDLLGFLVGAQRTAAAVHAPAPPAGRPDLGPRDNFVVTTAYADGSLATLTYTSLGDPAAAKERIEVSWDDKTAVIDDFVSLATSGVEIAARRSARPDKGHRAILERFVEHLEGDAPPPIPWDEIADVTRLTFDLDDELRGSGRGE
ncbi:MAG TPA: Gfo/Idh/MocA family oxidoreductase, partial [Candidatus Polarisedimenticolaceae bacterium]|nr:Gfo/Idh/MocA family oxidoreductase [Candidatus Polarisedimenticolaceae bacterium]